MSNFNKVILAGYLTKDPELRYTPKGTAVAKFGIGINRSWTTESGEKREEATFVDIDSFGKTAEVIGQWFRKGSPILVEGRLKLDQWEDKQTGAKRSKLGVILESFSFIGKKEDGAGSGSGAPAPASRYDCPGRTAAPPSADQPPIEDDDVPF